MKIVVIGGTGLIGSKVVRLLSERGHEVIAASPKSGVNTMTGEGLDAALLGAEVVLDLANSPSFEDKAALDFFVTAGTNLLAAEARAGVRHHVALSVVGTEGLQESGYFRGKLAQERLIKASPTLYTIVHATQFLEFLGSIANSVGADAAIPLSTALIQPIASDDVAAFVAEAALAQPINGTIEIAGPEKFRLADLVARYLGDIEDNRKVQPDPEAKYFGARLDEASLLPRGAARLGAVTYANWLKTSRPTR
ncbi:NmrA family transcriptional regulator [Devosia riboflavina]|uniref:NmrA family transcriptional regulator n=1 Tax=Devosia riboflavina TaxID=46914 RepID=A0A087M7R1_9HYPH|nr:SDR family oxidoreductase [Devosia riboflavina]KFL32914.1 NmrA family transcriptional regulator [Devosia riboflavina]